MNTSQFPMAAICKEYLEGTITYSIAQKELVERGLAKNYDDARMILSQAVNGQIPGGRDNWAGGKQARRG